MIEYLEIQGFKSIKNLAIELRPINVLIGSNGAGKSNFVAFFKLLDALYHQRLRHYVQMEKADNILHFGRKRTEFFFGKVVFSIESNYSNTYSFKLSANNEGGLFISGERYGFDGPRVTMPKYFQDQYENMPESKLYYQDHPRDQPLKKQLSDIQSYHFHDTSPTSRLRQPCDIEDNAKLKTDGRNLPAFLYYMQERHPKRFLRLVKTIQTIAPYLDRFLLEPSRLNPQEISLRWIEKGDPDSNFGAYHFSDGTLRFIALATVLMQPEPPSVIIIDEPELGLHPQAIIKLAGLIQKASQKTQLILSTQSVNLVNCFEAEDIVTVDRNTEQNQSVFQRLEADKLGGWLNEHALGELWERNIINSAQPFMQ